ncbi:MAG: hypothetical protein U0R44_06535 [Candidatus Micrarchaeia archaeon]
MASHIESMIRAQLYLYGRERSAFRAQPLADELPRAPAPKAAQDAPQIPASGIPPAISFDDIFRLLMRIDPPSGPYRGTILSDEAQDALCFRFLQKFKEDFRTVNGGDGRKTRILISGISLALVAAGVPGVVAIPLFVGPWAGRLFSWSVAKTRLDIMSSQARELLESPNVTSEAARGHLSEILSMSP